MQIYFKVLKKISKIRKNIRKVLGDAVIYSHVFYYRAPFSFKPQKKKKIKLGPKKYSLILYLDYYKIILYSNLIEIYIRDGTLSFNLIYSGESFSEYDEFNLNLMKDLEITHKDILLLQEFLNKNKKYHNKVITIYGI